MRDKGKDVKIVPGFEADWVVLVEPAFVVFVVLVA
jgi:hypothetical protein